VATRLEIALADTGPVLDLLLDPDTGDLVVTDDLQFARGKTGIAQRVKLSLQLVLGEWFLDQSKGVDWFGQILVKNPNVLAIRQIIAQTILGVPGVSALNSLDIAYNNQTRIGSITFSVDTDFGLLEDNVTGVVA
jgi:hypothetical protein